MLRTLEGLCITCTVQLTRKLNASHYLLVSRALDTREGECSSVSTRTLEHVVIRVFARHAQILVHNVHGRGHNVVSAQTLSVHVQEFKKWEEERKEKGSGKPSRPSSADGM